MKQFNTSICVYPDIQDGEPVFSGTRIRVEVFFDYMRIGVSLNEFLREFPSVTVDQAMDAMELMQERSTFDALQRSCLNNLVLEV